MGFMLMSLSMLHTSVMGMSAVINNCNIYLKSIKKKSSVKVMSAVIAGGRYVRCHVLG